MKLTETTKKYDTTMIPDPQRPGWFMPRDRDIMETDTMALLNAIGVSDEKILESAYYIQHGELPIYTSKTVVLKKTLKKRLDELEDAAKTREAENDEIMPPAKKSVWGENGVRWDEDCDRCHKTTEIDNNTGLCRQCN